MAHPLVFIPHEHVSSPITEQALHGVGLSGWSGADSINTQGPTGKAGRLHAWRRRPTDRLHYNAAEQRWVPALPSGDLPGGRYWLGFWNDSPPTPGDLQRDYAWPGSAVTLGDGSDWMVPTPVDLPFDLKFRDDGSLAFVLQRQFHAYGVEVIQWRQKIANRTIVDATAKDLIEFAIRALSLNYRLTPEIVAAFDLLNTKAAKEVFFGAVSQGVRS